MTVESEEIEILPPNNCKLVFKTLTEDSLMPSSKKQIGGSGLRKTLKVQLCSS